jgi:hypothetical protein
MRALVLLTCLLALHAQAPSQILITEMQPVPAAGEPEWVEVENLGARAVRLEGWLLCDARSCVRVPEKGMAGGLQQVSTVAAHGRLILTRDAEALLECRVIPAGVPVIELALPSLNNSTETVELRDEDSVLVDVMRYNMKQHIKGRSLEREGREEADRVVYDTVWASCVAADSATCGALNSQVHLPRDRRVEGIVVYDAEIGIGFVNHGLQSMPGANVSIRGSPGGLSLATTIVGLLPGERTEWRVPLTSLGWPDRQGALDLRVVIREKDDLTTNDSLEYLLDLPPPPGVVTLTELMFDPWPEVKDYVEVANLADDTVALTGWIIEDAAGVRSVVSTLTNVSPHGYAVISSSDAVRGMMDSGGPGICKPAMDLNVSGDRVVLRSPAGFLVDEVTYHPDWHQNALPSSKGVSLEKLDPQLVSAVSTSWTSSGALRGGTPGAPNSVKVEVSTTFDLHATPSPFSSDRTSTRHPSIIGFTQPFRHAIASLTIRSPSGALIRSLLNATFTGSEGAVAWDGLDDAGQRVIPGPYVAVLECVDAASSSTHRAVCLVVVGE